MSGMNWERLDELTRKVPNYDDYDARVDVAELVAEVRRLKGIEARAFILFEAVHNSSRVALRDMVPDWRPDDE